MKIMLRGTMGGTCASKGMGTGDPDAGRKGASADSGEGAMSSQQRREKQVDGIYKVKVPAGPWEQLLRY